MQDWTNVVDAGPTERRFLRPSWFRAWELAYGQDRNWRRPVQYFTLFQDGSLRCVLPMATQCVGPFHFYSLCGTFLPYRCVPYCGNPIDLASRGVEALHQTEAAVGARLGPIPSDDAFLLALTQEFERAGWKVMCKEIGEEFVFENPGGVEKYAASLSGNRRRDVDRHWKKLCRQGPTELRYFNNCTVSEWENVFRDIRAVEAASWVTKSGEPRFLGQKNELFWQTLIGDAWFRHAIHVWLIYHADTAISFNLALDSGNTRYGIASSFDARFAAFGTGSKLFQQVAFDAFSRGIERINGGLGDSGFKAGWGARPLSTLVDLVAFSPSLSGSVAHLAAQTRVLTSRWRNSGRSRSSEPSNSTSAASTAAKNQDLVHAR